jgi:hypothetical protein
LLEQVGELMPDSDIGRAIAFFESTDDLDLLREVLRAIRPRASAAVRRHERSRQAVPSPDEISPSAEPAARSEALRTVRSIEDFGQLQAISRAVGRRIEALQQPDAR